MTELKEYVMEGEEPGIYYRKEDVQKFLRELRMNLLGVNKALMDVKERFKNDTGAGIIRNQ